MAGPSRVQIYRSRKGLLSRTQYRARVVSGNGKTLFVSAEGYNNLEDLLAIVDQLFPDLQRNGVGPGWPKRHELA
jgi:uncharacterized protein YegP (UPF0339 family)